MQAVQHEWHDWSDDPKYDQASRFLGSTSRSSLLFWLQLKTHQHHCGQIRSLQVSQPSQVVWKLPLSPAAHVVRSGLVLVTDAITAMGLPPGRHTLGQQVIEIQGLRAYVAGLTLISAMMMDV